MLSDIALVTELKKNWLQGRECMKVTTQRVCEAEDVLYFRCEG